MVKNWSVRIFLAFVTFTITAILLNIDVISKNLLYTFPIVVLPTVLYFTILVTLSNNKTASEILKSDFDKQNYTIITERALTLKEQYENYQIDFGFNYLSGTTTYSLLYKSKMVKYIVVKNEQEHYFELIVAIVHTWTNKFVYRILSKSRIRD